MVCDSRQLSQAQREAAFEQLRNAGAVKAIRPFSGEATPENLVDYLNREVFPVLKQTRKAVNDVFRPVLDNAPSGNPLRHIFSTLTTGGDPTSARLKLDNADAAAATTIRLSQLNAGLADIAPWLDVMAGSISSPLGTVTLSHVADPLRFARYDLTAMVDQGSYWDLTVTAIEASSTTPFAEGDGVVLGFIPGVASSGATLPPSSISPVAANTVIANATASTAAPTDFAVGTNSVLGRVAGNIVAAQLVNAQITDATIANAKLADMTAATVKGRARGATTGVPTDLTGSQLGAILRIGGQTDETGAPGTYDNYVVTEGTKLLRINPSSHGDFTITGIAYGSSNTDGWIRLMKQGADARIVLKHANSGSTATNQFQTPGGVDFVLSVANEAVDLQYIGGRWQVIGASGRGGRLGAPVYDVVLDFGAADDGATDDLAAINAAIAAANAAPGYIYFGNAHAVSAAPSDITGNNIILRGRGSFDGGTEIIVTAASAPAAVFTFTGQYCGIEDVRIRTSQVYATGSAILIEDSYRCVVQRCRIQDFANGIEVHASTLTNIFDCEFLDLLADYGVWVHGSALLGQAHATWIAHCIFDSAATSLTAYVHDGYAHTVRILDCSAVNGGYGLRVVDTVSAGADPPLFTRCVNLECDHNEFAGVSLEAGEQAEFEQLFITSVQDGPGVDIQSTFNGDWRIDGAFIFSTTEEGIKIAAPHGVLSGVIIGAASLGSNNTFDGIAVAANTTRFSIVGCSAGPSVNDAVAETRYGLSIGSGCDHFLVVGNRFSSNVTGGILNTPGTAGTRVVRNNLPDESSVSQVISVTPGGGSGTGGVYVEADLAINSSTSHICFDIQSDGDVTIASLPEALGRRLTISKTNDGTARRLVFPNFSTVESDTNKRISLPRETSSLVIADRMETREFVNLAPTNSGTNFWFLVNGMGATQNYLDNALGDAMVHNGSEWTKAAGGGDADVVLRGDATFGTVSTDALADDAVSNAKLAEMAANTVKANATASTANPTDFAVGTNSVLGRVAGNIVAAQLVNAQITDATIANAKLANMTAATVKGRALGAGTGAPTDLTQTQLSDLFRIVSGVTETPAPGTINDHPVADTTKLLRINPNGAGDVEYTGFALASGNTGGWIRLFKQSGGGTDRVVLKHDNAGSSANNRLLLPNNADFILSRDNDAVDLQYFGGRWQPLARSNDIADGDKGDITVASGGTSWTIDNDVVSNAKAANMAQSTIKGRAEGAGTGDPTDLTPTQAVAIIDGESPTWTGVHSFTGASHTVNVAGAVTLAGAGTTALSTSSGSLTVANLGGGTLTASTASGDIIVSAGDDLLLNGLGGAILQAKATPDTSQTAGEVKLNADTNIRLLTNSTERLEIESDGAWQLGGDQGDMGSPMLSQGSSSPPIWGDRSDINTTTTIIAAGTSAASTIVTLTIPANSLVVGSTYELFAHCVYVRSGSPATAHDIDMLAEANGSAMGMTLTVGSGIQNSNTSQVIYYGTFTCDSTGASGTAVATLKVDENIADVTNPLTSYAGTSGAGTIDTTANNTIRLRVDFSASVTGARFDAVRAWIKRTA